MAIGEPPLEIWAVSDGRAGIENQVMGLAEAMARMRPSRVTAKHVRYRGSVGRLPTWLNLAPRQALADGASGFAPPWPDVWVAAGRATLPLSLRVRRWSRGRTLTVQVQDPRWPPGLFDVVVPPAHDRVVGDNVVAITGSPHRVTPERLAVDLATFGPRLEPLPSPRVAVLIGGRSSAFDLTPARAAGLAREIGMAVEAEGGSVMVSFSRRTPEDARAILAARLATLPGTVWTGEGANPYFAFLAAADVILVTEDSTNMAVEAASTGKPVFVLKLEGGSAKFRRLHDELERIGAARPFGGTLHRWTYEPLRETERAAAAVLAAWEAKRGG